MGTIARRDDAQLVRGLTAWWAHRQGRPVAEIRSSRPTGGWSNETLLFTIINSSGPDDRLVIRLPPPLPAYPLYDLGAQARLLEVLGAEPAVPVPRVIAYEEDEDWVGTPFLVMSHEPGRPGPDAPALAPWLVEAPLDAQRRLHQSFLQLLGDLHRVDWNLHGLTAFLRGGEQSLSSEVAHWVDYADWATDGAPPSLLRGALHWCAQMTPDRQPAASLCWGDARIGNILLSDDFEILSVLDWELASIGPGEMDLAWYVALDGLVEHFTRQTAPGFLRREEAITCYERALGRPVADLGWHEIFALTRSAAISERLTRLAAAGGPAYPGVAGDANPVLHQVARRIEDYVT